MRLGQGRKAIMAPQIARKKGRDRAPEPVAPKRNGHDA